MASPYDKAIRHAKECARRGLSVESCGYKSPTWRSAWLKAYEEAQQMNFDDFETDVTTAEGNFNASNNTESTVHESTAAPDGNTGLCSPEESKAATTGKPSKAVKLGLFSGISNADYHSGPGISSSNIKPALKSLNLYNETRLGRVPFKETEAMKLGSAVHALTLEAYDFGNQIAISKKFGTSNKAKEEKAEFYKAHPGKIVITADDHDRCRYMRDSLLNLCEVREIFESGAPEMSGYYVDRETNMLCKYRADWENEWCIFDIKSTRDAGRIKFKSTINDLNYHLSAAHYLEGSRILTKQKHDWFVFGCVESEKPFEAAVYRLGEESLEAGQILRRNALNAIKHGRETDEWPLLNDGVAEVIDIPGWALNDLRISKI